MSDTKFEQSNCTRCGLRNEKAGFIQSRRSALMIVSDHPNMTEILYKTIFSGMAGDMFRRLLQQVNLDIDKIHITYAAACRLPGERPITTSELDCCRPRLVQEIKDYKPQIIVPMGNVALQQLLQKKEPITAVHGNIIWSPEFNCFIIPSFHPAAIVKSPKMFTDFAKDWQLIVDSLKNPPTPEKRVNLKTQFWVIPPEKLSATIDFLLKQPFISCDLETTGFSPITNRAFCGSFTWEEGKSIVFDEDILYGMCTTHHVELKRLFESAGPKWIWKNGKFDIKFIRAAGIKARIDEDVELQHYLLDERKGTHGLELLASQELGAPDYKSVIRKLVEAGGGDYSHADRMKMLEYNANDTDYTFRLWRIFEKRILAEDNLIYAYREVLIPAANALADFELKGVNADREYLGKLSEEYETKINDTKELLLSIANEVGWDCLEYQQKTQAKKPPKCFNPGSWQQLGYVIFNLLKLPKYKGSTTTDADAVDYWVTKVLKKPGDKVIEKSPEVLTEWLAKSKANVFLHRLAEYRKITKLYSTYIEGLSEEIELDGRIHTEFKIIGTETGRLSSKGPNVQNIPRGKLIKSAFIPSPGNVFIQADYSQCIAEDTWVSDDLRIQDHPEAVYKGESDTQILTTERGYSVECTKEHQIQTSTGWKPLSDIQKGDWIALQGENFEDKVFNPFWWVVGFWVGDGSFHNAKGTLQFSKKLPDDEEQIALLIAKGVNEIPRVYGSYSLNVTNQSQLVKQLHSMFDKKDLRIPFDKIADNGLSDFLSGLFDADASIDINGIEFSSRFVLLAKDVQLALLRFGIMSTLITTHTGYNYAEGGALQYKVHICDSISLHNFKQNIGFQLIRKQQTLHLVTTRGRRDQSNYLPIPATLIRNIKGIDYRKYVLNHLHGRPYTRNKIQELRLDEKEEVFNSISWYSRFHWDQVKEITPSGRIVKVYDLMDQPNNRFSANGVMVHNCELRVLAVLSKDPVMMQIYYDGKDLHDELSLTLFGPGFTKEQRVRAKAFNFGVAYGRTPESIAEEHAFPVSEARALKDAWYSRFSVAADYIEHSRKTPSLGITQQTPFGRKRRFPFITKENAWNIENEAVNFPIQSTASDLTLLSAVQLHKQTGSLADILILVHDSILFDVPKENVDALVPQILNVMQTLPGKYLNTDMPFLADVEIGHNWGNLDKLK